MPMTSTQTQTLYERIGGDAVITRLVDKFYDRVLSDPELAPFFAFSSTDKLRCMQKEFFSTALDGPQNYYGLSMVKAHAGRGIKSKHFNSFAQHLLATLREIGISEADVQAIIARINLRASEVTGDAPSSE